MFQSGLRKHPAEADILFIAELEIVTMGPRIGKTWPAGFAFSIHSFGIKKVSDSGGHRSLAERVPLYAENIFGIQRYTSLPSGDGKCVETTQGTTDGSNPSARGASRAAILQRFSPDNKSFDRPETASMRHTSKASEGILSSRREMNDSTSCYHAMTAVCHGCTAIDEILQSWIYRKQMFKPCFAYG